MCLIHSRNTYQLLFYCGVAFTVQCNFYKLVLVLTVCFIDFIMDADLIVSCYMHYDRGAFLLQPLTAFTFY